jgi:hypothetical protein
MATTVRFRDHEGFQRAALHMTIAGVLAGLAVHIAGGLVPGFGPITYAWAAAALLGATAFGAASPGSRLRLRELILLGMVSAGAGAAAALFGTRPGMSLVGPAALALGFGVLVARGGRRFAATLITAGAAFLLCQLVLENLVAAADAAAVPAWITAGVTGGAFAFVGVLGLLPRHVDLGVDRVRAAHDGVKDKLTGETRELADRGLAVWKRIEPSLEPSSAVRRGLEDSVCRLFDVAGRWAEVEADGARTPVETLAARMEAIAGKVEKSEDPVAREQYAQAHAALAEQLRYLREIATTRERIIARMHHYLAAMERLRFAVINHRSADASRLATEVAPILEDLQELGRDIDSSSEAMGEMERN